MSIITDKKIAIIGGGAMGGATAAGAVAAGIAPENITVANPHLEKLAGLEKLGVNVTVDNIEAVRGADLIVLAVKPWILSGVVAEIRDSIDYSRQEVALIVAGISGNDLASMFRKDGNLPVLSIVMPNTAMRLRLSMTFIVEISGRPAQLAISLMELLGKVSVIEERLLPAGMSLASCGIAFAMRYVRAAMEGGVELGFRASEAQKIVAATLYGAAALLEEPGSHPETEIDKVTTPGGITIRGLNAMEAAGFTTAVIEGLKESAR